MNRKFVVLLAVLAAGCGSAPADRDGGTAVNPSVGQAPPPPMDPKRKVSEQDCSGPIETGGANLMCREVSQAELRARLAEEERQARLRREAAERAERERLERERAERLAREEAARKAREAEEARLRAEQLAREEAARKAKEAEEARLRAEQEAREAAERERLRREQEAREAAERERQRIEQEWLAGRAHLESFVATYGNVARFKSVSGQITRFLEKTK